ncbi:hypothetical protein ABU162_18925 [Paenibacillus thiaminolyticus]
MADQPIDGNDKKVSDLDPHMHLEQNGLAGCDGCPLPTSRFG